MNPPARQHGFSLLELAIALTILAVLISVAAPGFSAWLGNGKILALTEGFQHGLQLARVEAVRRNTQIYFQITDTTTDDCTETTSGANWVVRTDDTVGGCATAATIIQSRAAAEGSTHLVVAADCATLGFDSLGQLIERGACDPPVDGQYDYDINVPGGQCVAAGGSVRCRRVLVSLGGQIRICDPAVTAIDDPRRC